MIEEKKNAESGAPIPCSIALLTLNSDEHLAQCLESAARFDVFILDGNSTDQTLAIAHQFHVPVFKQVETEEKNVRIKDFSAMRLRGREMAKNDWIFDLDSDEYISPALAVEVAEQLAIHKDNLHVGFNIQNKHIIEGKLVEHSFNESFGLRLYNKKSGVSFIKGKVVHEKYDVPKDLTLITLKHCIYSYVPDTFADCIKKDNYYLELVWTKSVHKYASDGTRAYKRACWSIVKNLARAGIIFGESLLIYVRYGFKRSLPPSQVVRYIRYHLLLSYFGLKWLWIFMFNSTSTQK